MTEFVSERERSILFVGGGLLGLGFTLSLSLKNYEREKRTTSSAAAAVSSSAVSAVSSASFAAVGVTTYYYYCHFGFSSQKKEKVLVWF